jgi:hypothetical protein
LPATSNEVRVRVELSKQLNPFPGRQDRDLAGFGAREVLVEP